VKEITTMASNKELADQAEALAKDLGIEVKTEGLGNQALKALVDDLTAKADSVTNPQGAAPDGAPPRHEPESKIQTMDGATGNSLGGPPPPTVEAPPEKFPYQVAPGKSLTCLRGVLGPGHEVRPEFFSAQAEVGKATLKDLLEKGYVIEGKRRGSARAG
jgi:hypothetical protein